MQELLPTLVNPSDLKCTIPMPVVYHPKDISIQMKENAETKERLMKLYHKFKAKNIDKAKRLACKERSGRQLEETRRIIEE